MKITETPDIIIPISMELDHPTEDSIVADILELYENFGYRKFLLAASDRYGCFSITQTKNPPTRKCTRRKKSGSPKWQGVTRVEYIVKNGSRREVRYTRNGMDMTLLMTLAPSEPVYLIFS